ncbi:MAG: hypothetical protein HC898_04040 [Phycisphaerales bacterium]|nr:hypothetical protein [Phycisphaerales bacterium]
MRFITVTSDNYVAATARMVASLRQWHADDPVVVYALEQDWNSQLEKHFDGMQLQIRHLPEPDKRYRQGTLGQSVFARWKLDVFLDQQEPFIFLDSDTLLLRPLYELIKQTLELGWFTVNEGTTLGQYAQGDISHHVELPDHDESRSGFNTGVVGCVPEGHREVFELAAQWAAKIKGNLLGDQGLLNLAWYELHGDLPPGQSSLYNGGWHTDDTMNLSQAILHFARPNYTTEQKLHDHHRIWEAWPRGIA